MTLVLEPWGHEVCLTQGDWVCIKLESHLEGEPEVIFEEWICLGLRLVGLSASL